MIEYPLETIRDLLGGRLPWHETHQIMSSYKDADRFQKYRAIVQEQLGWDERVVLPLGEHLVIVESDHGCVVRCTCGHEFGDYRRNWKLEARIIVRDAEETLEEIYPGRTKPDPEWMEIREFICPDCGVLLEVEAVPPGYPVMFDFLPDLRALYEVFLGEPAPAGA
jgi:acetone carboxylase gamma subunit